MSSKSNRSSLRKKISLSEDQYSVLIFLFFLVKFLIFGVNRRIIFSSVVSTYYILCYNQGFIPRAFIGSVISLFTNYLTNDVLNIIISVITLLLLALVSIMLAKAISKSAPEFKPATLLFTFLLITAPLSNTYLVERHFGRLDTFLLLFTLLALACLKKPYLKWTVPALCFAAVATHPGYMVTYMPALAIPLLYEVYRNKYSKKSIMLFFSCCLILISFFVYFQYLSPQVNFANAEAFGAYLSKHTDMKISNPVLYLEYFSQHLNPLTNPNSFTDLMLPMLKNTALPTILVFFAFSFPLIIIFAAVWKIGIRNADNIFLKFIYILCALSPLVFIPAALFGQDWERWWAAVINCQFIFIFYFIISLEKSLMDSLKMITNFFDTHSLILLCILAFSSSLILSNINSFILFIFDRNIWFNFFDKVLTNFEHLLN